jgi:hypothetical protein
VGQRQRGYEHTRDEKAPVLHCNRPRTTSTPEVRPRSETLRTDAGFNQPVSAFGGRRGAWNSWPRHLLLERRQVRSLRCRPCAR